MDMPFDIESHEWFQLDKTCVVYAKNKILYDFDTRIKYDDGTDHVRITLKTDLKYWLGDYLGQKVEEFRCVLKTLKYQEHEPFVIMVSYKTLEMTERMRVYCSRYKRKPMTMMIVIHSCWIWRK